MELKVQMLSRNDYYAFGQQMPGRTYATSLGGYRYGFNGQEKDDEVYGAGNSNTAEFWQYDTRLGRRWNRDPKGRPEESSYACFGDNPILNSDINGDFWISDHIAIDRQANRIAYGRFWGGIRTLLSIPKTFIIETIKSKNNAMHLDNMSNEKMQSFLNSGGYNKMNSHTLQDFYSHSNYVEIMRENGVADKDMVTFDKLEKGSALYTAVMAKIETTKHPDSKETTNGHDAKKSGGYEVLASEANNDNSLTPRSSDKFMAKDANGSDGKGGLTGGEYHGFKHPDHEVAKKLAIDATVNQKEGSSIDNTK